MSYENRFVLQSNAPDRIEIASIETFDWDLGYD